MTNHKTCHKDLTLIGLKKFYYKERVKISKKTLVVDDEPTK